jgi:hypothetical protein
MMLAGVPVADAGSSSRGSSPAQEARPDEPFDGGGYARHSYYACARASRQAPPARLARRRSGPIPRPRSSLVQGWRSSFVNGAIDAYGKRAKTIRADIRLVVHPRGQHGFDLAPGDA